MKNVLVLGAGISGLGAAHVLLRHECNVIVSDLKDNIKDKKEKEILQSFGVVFEFGMQSVELLDGIDTVVVSPVISAENIVVMEAFKRRIPVISEIELAYRVTKAPILAVTGTNGKTTTTTLLGSMIGHSSIPFAVAGNLGISLSREAELVAEIADLNIQRDIYLQAKDRDRWLSLISQHVEVRDFEVQMLRKDGDIFWAEVNGHLVRDSAGHIVCIEGTVYDPSHQFSQKIKAQLSNP